MLISLSCASTVYHIDFSSLSCYLSHVDILDLSCHLGLWWCPWHICRRMCWCLGPYWNLTPCWSLWQQPSIIFKSMIRAPADWKSRELLFPWYLFTVDLHLMVRTFPCDLKHTIICWQRNNRSQDLENGNIWNCHSGHRPGFTGRIQTVMFCELDDHGIPTVLIYYFHNILLIIW